MSTISQGVRIGPPGKGVRRDLPQRAVPADAAYKLWNWLLRDGKVVVRPGLTQLGSSLGSRVNGMVSYLGTDRILKLVASTATDWYYWDGSSWVDITPTPLNGNEATVQVFRTFKMGDYNYLLGVNGVDPPKKWPGSGTVSNVGGNPPVARCISCAANRVLLGNVVNHPARVYVSDFNNFESGWDSVQIVDLTDTPGEIVAMVEMGNLISVIYKTDSIYLATATAALYPFRFDLKASGVDGPAGPLAVVPTANAHFYFSRSGHIYRFNGVSVDRVGDHISALIAATGYSVNRHYQVFGFYDPVSDELWFFYPREGYAYTYTGLVIKSDGSVWPVYWSNLRFTAGLQHIMEDYLTIGEMTEPLSYYTMPLMNYTGYFPRVMLGDRYGKVFYFTSGTNDAGDNIPVIYESGIFEPLQDQAATVVEVEHRFSGDTSGVQVKLGYADGADLSWESAKEVSARNGFRRTAKRFALSYTGEVSSGYQLEWDGTLVFGVPRGRR